AALAPRGTLLRAVEVVKEAVAGADRRLDLALVLAAHLAELEAELAVLLLLADHDGRSLARQEGRAAQGGGGEGEGAEGDGTLGSGDRTSHGSGYLLGASVRRITSVRTGRAHGSELLHGESIGIRAMRLRPLDLLPPPESAPPAAPR